MAVGPCLLLLACSPVQQVQSAAAAGGSLVNSVTGSGEQMQLGSADLRTLQSREFTTTKGAAFASVMTVLLDSGYRVVSADLQSGLITASAPTSDRLKVDLTGLARANETPLASAYVEERETGIVTVRVSFSIGRSASGALASTGERAVLDPTPYGAFFDQLSQEIRQRPQPAVQASDAGETGLISSEIVIVTDVENAIPVNVSSTETDAQN